MSENIERTGIGYGFTEKEAFSHWLQNDPALQAYGLGFGDELIDKNFPVLVVCQRRPRLAKRVSTERFPQKGTRKFVTSYRVIDPITGDSMSFEGDVQGLIEGKLDVFNQQADAVNAAKDLSRFNHQPYEVHIVKTLIEGNKCIARLSPHESVPGEYKFTATFLY